MSNYKERLNKKITSEKERLTPLVNEFISKLNVENEHTGIQIIHLQDVGLSINMDKVNLNDTK